MRTIVLASAINFFVVLGLIAIALPAHAVVPCEDMLKSMRHVRQTTSLSAADKQTVDGLETKAVERCNADDDTRADAFLAEAMKVMGK